MSQCNSISRSPIILGIDPSYRSTGYGVIKVNGNDLTCIAYGTIQKKEKWPNRLWSIYSGIMDVVEEYKPDEVAVEEVFVAKNVKTSLKLGHVRGAVMIPPLSKQIPVYEYTPLDVKKAVSGYGRAEKDQIKYMIKQLLKLDSEPESDDASDALALSICHANVRKMKLLTEGKI